MQALRTKLRFTLHDGLLLAALLLVFAAAAIAEAAVAPLGASALLRLWIAQALQQHPVGALAHAVGWAAVAAALPTRATVVMFGQNALAIRLPLLLVSAGGVVGYAFLLRLRTSALPALVGSLFALTVCGVAPLAVALPLRALPLLLLAGIAGWLAAKSLQRFPLRFQALAATLCFFLLMGRCAGEGIGEIHQRRTLQMLEQTVDRAAAPGEDIFVGDEMLAAPLWFYGSEEVRQQMVLATAAPSNNFGLPVRMSDLARAGDLPFKTTLELPRVNTPQPEVLPERVVLARPGSTGAGMQIVVLQENIPWSRLGGFISPLASPQTRILFETSAPPREGISLQP